MQYKMKHKRMHANSSNPNIWTPRYLLTILILNQKNRVNFNPQCVLTLFKLQEVADRHGIAFHSFADDIQLNKSVRTKDVHAAKQAVIDCVLDIQRWSNSHHLKLIAAKSRVIWLGTRQ